ncbi:XRE family transcriptional regulator [Caballeronia sp. LZ033]|uniref:XRE family transcriptional regulator n=1 Tax=Caballeronia sp. LZ033 TaxID=3038566 RepID=UPI002865997A|nr:XRE family transcriptional regulator [Caballeronia sp. LZ033]MDR5813345.1 XRE family transcriptional regulator [Caballeronia sp. LZ033]
MDNNNKDLPLMGGLLTGPTFLADADVARCMTYRDAVRLAWAKRRSMGMSQSTLAERCGLYASHVTDYLNARDADAHGRTRRSLPAEKISIFEATVGNRAITQFLIRQAQLTCMEEIIAQRAQRAA